jgi:hypothetical protein
MEFRILPSLVSSAHVQVREPIGDSRVSLEFNGFSMQMSQRQFEQLAVPVLLLMGYEVRARE